MVTRRHISQTGSMHQPNHAGSKKHKQTPFMANMLTDLATSAFVLRAMLANAPGRAKRNGVGTEAVCRRVE